ncbi:MAG: Ig-like domain-containing protein [Thermoleophilia bacterium]
MEARSTRLGWTTLLLTLALMLAAASAAWAAPRSGSVTDPEDRPPHLSGELYPDVTGLQVAYDPDTGGLQVAMDLAHGTTPAANSHSDPYISLTFEVGGTSPNGRECMGAGPSSRTGDLSVSASHYSSNSDTGDALAEHWNLYVTVAGYSGSLSSQQGTISPDRRRITWSFPGHTALVRRDYTCVTRAQMTSYPDWWIDEIAPFFFTGFAPPPPPAADRAAPKVDWASPKDGDVISGVWQEAGVGGRHACRIDARDNVAVVRVDVQLDGRFLNRELYAPWACVLDTTTIANGTHRLTATAYDAAGNAASSTIEVTVRNTPATPPPDPVQPPVPPPVTPDPLTPVTPVTPPAPVTTTPSVPATPVVTADAVAPAVRLGVASRSLRALLATGLVVPVRCDEACTVRLRLVIDAPLARRLRVNRLLRETTVTTPGPGVRAVAILRPPAAARRALAGRRVLAARLVAVATDAAGNRRTTVLPVRLV